MVEGSSGGPTSDCPAKHPPAAAFSPPITVRHSIAGDPSPKPQTSPGNRGPHRLRPETLSTSSPSLASPRTQRQSLEKDELYKAIMHDTADGDKPDGYKDLHLGHVSHP